MKKIQFFVPESHLEQVKTAMFNAGAGQVGHYSHCCWQTKGVSQFKPLPGANPHIGSEFVLEQLSEFKVEMVCIDNRVLDAIKALKQAHPYEEPAFDVIELLNTPS